MIYSNVALALCVHPVRRRDEPELATSDGNQPPNKQTNSAATHKFRRHLRVLPLKLNRCDVTALAARGTGRIREMKDGNSH